MYKYFNPKNWFVLQTQSGKEHKLKASIDYITEDAIPTYLPQKKIRHTVKGAVQIVKKPLFPGYLFVQNDIERILFLSKVRRLPEKIRPVIFHGSPAIIREEEMFNIFIVAGKDGVVELSEACCVAGQSIKIIHGPLKEINGEIIFIDKRKRKAKIMVRLINKMVPVTLGFEMIEDFL